MAGNIKITLKRSVIGETKRTCETIKSLGLTKTGRSVVRKDSSALRGAIKKVGYLLKWEEC